MFERQVAIASNSPALPVTSHVSVGLNVEFSRKSRGAPAWDRVSPKGNELVFQRRTTPQMVDWNGEGLVDLEVLDADASLAREEPRRGIGGELEPLAPAGFFRREAASVFSRNGRPDNKESGLPPPPNDFQCRGGRHAFRIVDQDRDAGPELMLGGVPTVNFLCNPGKNSGGLCAFRDERPASTLVFAGHAAKPTGMTSERAVPMGSGYGDPAAHAK